MSNQVDLKVNAILSVISGSKHILHLYSPSMNKYAIQAAFLAKKGKGRQVIVTGENRESVLEQFNSIDSELSMLHPFHLSKIKDYNTVIIDAETINPSLAIKKPLKGLQPKKRTLHKRKVIGQSEIIKTYITHIERENYLNGLKTNSQILCTYNISKLDPDNLRELVQAHDKLILTTDDIMVLSSSSLSLKNLKLNEKIAERFVKNELETIILALVSSKPMTGNDIKKIIHEKFNTLLSSGTIYPLLHKLEKQGLLKCRFGVKSKHYEIMDEDKTKNILNETIQIKNFLNSSVYSSQSQAVESKE